VTLAMINVIGGYFVTDRMLGMFKPKDQGSAAKAKREEADR
jgi:NAD/NADP transhydrogenase alpha subunit